MIKKKKKPKTWKVDEQNDALQAFHNQKQDNGMTLTLGAGIKKKKKKAFNLEFHIQSKCPSKMKAKQTF